MNQELSSKRGANRAIALFGGVFDPIHSAHVEIARQALDRLPITEVRFLPAGTPPHKAERPPESALHRIAMIERAIAFEPRFRLDIREINRPGPSYTILTLEELGRELPGTAIFFLIGADNARTIGSWHRAEEIFRACDPVVIARPGESVEFTAADLPFLDPASREQLNSRVIDGVALAQSSSEIRDRIEKGLSIEGWVAPAVARYIEENGLYLRPSE